MIIPVVDRQQTNAMADGPRRRSWSARGGGREREREEKTAGRRKRMGRMNERDTNSSEIEECLWMLLFGSKSFSVYCCEGGRSMSGANLGYRDTDSIRKLVRILAAWDNLVRAPVITYPPFQLYSAPKGQNCVLRHTPVLSKKRGVYSVQYT
jgi:hypothetical protein